MNSQSRIISLHDVNRPSRRRRATSSSQNSRNMSQRRYSTAYDEDDDVYNNEQDESNASALSSKMERARRSRTKKKANRRFDRQYGNPHGSHIDNAASSANNAPRAAVYKTKMGSNHKKAARMQANSAHGAKRSRVRSGAGASSQQVHRFPARWQMICLGVILFVVVGCAILYAPAQQYYQDIRERDRLQAEYEAVQARNDSIQEQIDFLSTDAGIADKAREEFGWVEAGETLGSVSGLSSEGESTFVANIVPGSVEAPETWYSRIFDPLFNAGNGDTQETDESD